MWKTASNILRQKRTPTSLPGVHKRSLLTRNIVANNSINNSEKTSKVSTKKQLKPLDKSLSSFSTPGVSISKSFFSTTTKTLSTSHPLDPLTAAEIKSTSNAVKEFLNDPSSLRFTAISLCEPEKGASIATKQKERKAEVVILKDGICSELIVNLSSEAKVIHHKELPVGTQPLYSPDDCDLAEEIVKNSSEVKQALLDRYGITDVEKQLVCDPWSVNLADEFDRSLTFDVDAQKPRRLIQTFLYMRMLGLGTMEDNHYAHPIDIVPVVDLNTGIVVRIDGMDRNPPPKIPDKHVNYHPKLLESNSYLETDFRDDLPSTLNIIQPDGPSFKVDGNNVSWQGWTFHVGFNYREGLVLNDLKYHGRDVIHRASLVEMAVPYGDVNPPFQRKCAFDVGDYGLGYCSNSLELGCDW